MSEIIPVERSIIPACDVELEHFREITEATADTKLVGAYKVGVSFLDAGLKEVVRIARAHSDKPIIYDHQKAGTDIPESSPQAFMDSMVRSGIDAVILFPQAGPVTQFEWTRAAQERDLDVIVGGEMTHPRFIEGDTSNGKKVDYTEVFRELGIKEPLTGYIRSSAPKDIFELAAKMGVTNFVVPGNKPEKIGAYRDHLISCGVSSPVFFAPGFVAQGGSISDATNYAGDSWHAIVGRGITKAEDIKKAVAELTSQLG